MAAPFLFVIMVLTTSAASAQIGAGQVPGTTIGIGTATIRAAWLAAPTTRYPHGALGDDVEAGALVVRDDTGRDFWLHLPEDRVFEDLSPRVVTDQDLGDLAMVVESQKQLGARLSMYGVQDGRLILRSATPYIGTANRWLAPVGIGDFDGDGQNEIALVAMPHLSGLLRIYRLQEQTMPLLAEVPGYTNHVIGTAEIAMSAVLARPDGDRILLPSLDRRRLVQVSFRGRRLYEEWAMALPARLVRLQAVSGRCHAELEDGSRMPFTC